VWQRILDEGTAYDTASLREVLPGTSRVDLDLVDALKARFPGSWTSVAYGSTEIGRGAVLTDADLHVKPLSVGLPPPAVEARVDADGELLQRGPTMFTGYLDRPDATASAIDADGWYHTGDLATCDADGYLTITGRRSESIRSGASGGTGRGGAVRHIQRCRRSWSACPTRWGSLCAASSCVRVRRSRPSTSSARMGGTLIGAKQPRVVVQVGTLAPTPPARSAAAASRPDRRRAASE
jgi:hypothetical protein